MLDPNAYSTYSGHYIKHKPPKVSEGVWDSRAASVQKFGAVRVPLREL